MELNELKSVWQAYDKKLEKSLKLNLRCLEMIQGQKVKSRLVSLLRLRVLEVMLHLVIIFWLTGFLYTHFFETWFAVSAGLLLVFFIIAFINCIKQIVLIKEIDYSEDITTIQRKLTLLQSHIVDYIRLTFLCMPTYLAYPVIAFKAFANFDIVSQLSRGWWIGQLSFTVLLLPLCAWLYRQVRYKNIHKKWVKYIIEKSAGDSVSKAMEFIREIDELKRDSQQG
jgi:hypothetical protein